MAGVAPRYGWPLVYNNRLPVGAVLEPLQGGLALTFLGDFGQQRYQMPWDEHRELYRLPISRATAREYRAKTYFTGELCEYGHRAGRKTCNHCCYACDRLKDARRYTADPQGEAARTRASRYRTPAGRFAERAKERARTALRGAVLKGCDAWSTKTFGADAATVTAHLMETLDERYRNDPTDQLPWPRPDTLAEAVEQGWQIDHVGHHRVEFGRELYAEGREPTDAEVEEQHRRCNHYTTLRLLQPQRNKRCPRR